MKGRKPTPTALKVVRGNPGKRSLNKNEPKPALSAPNCPTWLSREGKAEWRRVVPELDAIHMLALVDRAALATYCELWATFMSAQREVHEHGLIMVVKETESLDGQTIYCRAVKNPAVLIAKDAAAGIRQFCAEFGLTPSSRARIDLPPADDERDAAADFFS